jgi:hypothetical protein
MTDRPPLCVLLMAQAARGVGVRLRRTPSLNTSPCFIAMLEAPVQERCHTEP